MSAYIEHLNTMSQLDFQFYLLLLQLLHLDDSVKQLQLRSPDDKILNAFERSVHCSVLAKATSITALTKVICLFFAESRRLDSLVYATLAREILLRQIRQLEDQDIHSPP